MFTLFIRLKLHENWKFNLVVIHSNIGKPLTEEHIRWERIGYDMTIKTSTTFSNGTSYLHIKDSQRADVGNFRCIADNRVANPTSRDVLLIVKCECRCLYSFFFCKMCFNFGFFTLFSHE